MLKRLWLPLLAVVFAAACSGQRASSAEIAELPPAPQASVSSWAPPEQMGAITCDNVMAVLWPSSEGKPTPPGWRGPVCQEAEGITLTWTYSDREGAPEAADAAVVALNKALRNNGWQNLTSTDSEAGADVEMSEKFVSPEGRHAEVTYTVNPNMITTLVVEFQR